MPAATLKLQLDSKLGAAFLGNLAAAIFYGVTSVQTFLYFRSNSRDTFAFKALIFFLWILDGVHLAFITHGLYYYMVSNFANPVALLVPTWSVLAQVYITCISDLIIRAIFTRRVFVLSSRKWLLIVIIAIFSLTTAVTGSLFAATAENKTFFALNDISWILYTALSSGVAADCFIAVSLVFFLLQARTGFEKTDSLVNTLMAYTINTGLFTTLCQIACLITYAVWPMEFIFMGVYFSLSALYLNSLLATLNARGSLREAHGLTSVPMELSKRSSKYPSQLESISYGETSMTHFRPLVISVDRHIETTVQADDKEPRAI
ncbi:hypothetical protein HGRIS_000940 [Hohenbuehelia grisea]|uniref:DUF6534 domain-containing protein n=1 Tax=Hohenbuehelia grisea TaxID=104357 RepID=A0ABR3IQB2_9AGAR